MNSPGDLGLRLAAMYPLRWAAVSNLYQAGRCLAPMLTEKESETLAFKRLAALSVPEKLTSLREFKFELHNAYLAADWNKSEELLSRLALLGLLRPAEMHALRGKFWFLSVFGRQIEFEMRMDEFSGAWVYSLPGHGLRHPELGYFARPEFPERASAPHWVLAAWCVDPRSPEPWPGRELPQIAEDGLLIDRVDLYGDKREADPVNVLREIRASWSRLYRDFQPVSFHPLAQRRRERLILAADDLRRAAPLAEDVAVTLLPMLARAEFALGNFSDAGAAFERVVKDGVVFKDEDGREESYSWEIQFSAAWSYHQAGDHQRAIDTMAKAAGSRGTLPGTGWWIAKWYSECGRYEEAARHLRAESENEWVPAESWLLSPVLALAAMAKDVEGRAEKFAAAFERKNPQVLRVIKGLISAQWPRFEKLSPQSQDRWVYAVYLTYEDPVIPLAEPQNLRNAVREYGWVLEHELMSKIFDPFRKKRVLPDIDLQKKSRDEYSQEPADSLLAYIHRPPNEITAGEMIRAITQSSAPRNDTQDALRRWLNKRYPEAYDCVPAMKEMNFARNRATHESPVYNRSDVVEMAATCKRALNWV